MPGPDSCPTDSSEDEERETWHKLVQIAQAIHKGQRVTISIQGQLQGHQDRMWEVLFQKNHSGPVPSSTMEVFQAALLEIMG
jgi:hypothetical protein